MQALVRFFNLQGSIYVKNWYGYIGGHNVQDFVSVDQ